MLLLLMFMYIFSFKIYSIFDSAILVGLIMGYYFIVHEEYQKKILNGIKNKYVINVSICMILLLIWSFISLYINKSADYTYIKTLFHLYLNIFIGYLLFNYYDFRGKKIEIVNHILLAFFIQSYLQWLFFAFPSISKVFNIFRTESMILNNIKYSGYRGLALSSTGFFGLSSAYGLMSILFFSKYNNLCKFGIKKYIFLLILYSGTFFAGRTGFISLPFVLILTIVDVKNNWKMVNKKSIVKHVFVAFCSLILLFVVTYNIPKFRNMYNYSFELVQNVVNGKGFFTTSTDKMFKMYNVNISTNTVLFGDGKYTIVSKDGTNYYQNTDIGYLRKILFFGLPGLLLSIYFEIVIFEKNMKNKINIMIFLLLLIFEFKGEVIGIAILMNSILIMYCMLDSFVNNSKKNESVTQKTNTITEKISNNNDIFIDKKNKVTVIMSVYNESVEILKQSIESILNQSFCNFEVIIVMDNPDNEEVIKYLKKLSNKKNITVIFNKKNIGLPLSLNRAIKHVKTEYIARMDADDIALPNRLDIQYNYMENNKNIDLISSGITYMDYDGNILYNRDYLPTGYKNIEKVLSYANVLHHPTFFGRTKMFKKIKYSNLRYAQDYDFACRACENGYKIDLTNEIVLKYRLMNNYNDDKKIRQMITSYFIRKLYKKKELSNSNVAKLVENEIKTIDKNNILTAIKCYERSFVLKKQKKYFLCVYNIIKSASLSKYHRRIVIDIFCYYCLKKYWRIKND